MWELMKSAIAKKALQMSKDSGTTPIKSNVTSGSSKSSSSSKNNTSTSSSSTSGTSYAYDPSGNKVDVVIKNGQSYLSDGSRIGVGYTVQTGGGIYKMTDSGGVKVDSHNTSKITPGTSSGLPSSSGSIINYDRNPNDTQYVKNSSGWYAPEGGVGAVADRSSYTGTAYDFDKKYDSIIRKVSSLNGDRDMNTSSAMLKAGLEMASRGQYSPYIENLNLSDAQMQEMLSDYNIVKTSATESAMNPNSYATNSYGESIRTADMLGNLQSGNYGVARADGSVSPSSDLGTNRSGYTQEELAYGYDQIYGSGAGGAGYDTAYSDVQTIGYAPQGGSTINYNITNGIDPNMWADAIRAIGSGQPSPIEIDLHVPFGNGADPMSGLYKSGNNYAINEGGEIIQISEDDYVKYLSNLVNF